MSDLGTRYPTLGVSPTQAEYTKRDTLSRAMQGSAVGAIFGLNVALIKNSLTYSRSVFGGVRGRAGVVGTFALTGAAFAFGEGASANLREKNSPINYFSGGALAGAIAGASLRRSVSKSLGGALVLGSIAATLEWGFDRGKKESVRGSDTQETKLTEEHPRQGFWELVHRRPLSQTVEELGDLAKQIVRD